MKVKVDWRNNGRSMDLGGGQGTLEVRIEGDSLRTRKVTLIIDSGPSRVEFAGEVSLTKVEGGKGVVELPDGWLQRGAAVL